jgi:Nucleotidyl transferase of unknown function (DUF2204)
MPKEDVPLPITSSVEPEWSAEAVDCYATVLQVFDRRGIRCVVGGGFALHEHTGIWRTTKDLDFLMEACEVPAALAALKEVGYTTWVEDPVWLAKAARGDYFVDLISGMGNAALRVTAGWIDRAKRAEILGVRCRILAAEEMIASKLFVTRRERFDGSDVAHLIRSCSGALDWDRVLQLVGEHWEMLYWSLVLFAYVYPAETDRVPQRVWRQLTQRFAVQVREPQPDAPFRGSLIDPKMFAIDVNEWGLRNLYAEYCDRNPCPLDVEKGREPAGAEEDEAA